jgi:hypothetical protein
MAKITRSASVSMLRYCARDIDYAPTLHELGVRVDVIRTVAIASMAEASAILGQLDWVPARLASVLDGKLLTSKADAEGWAFAEANPKALPRGVFEVAGPVGAGPIAAALLRQLVLQQVQVTLDTGESYIAQACGHDGIMGSVVAQPDPYDEWTRGSAKTKFALVRRDKRPSGED